MKSLFLQRAIFCFICVSLVSYASFSQTTILASGSSWKYLDNGSDQGTAWRASGFNDASWKTGSAKFGYGDAAATVVFSGCGTSSYPAPEDPVPTCGTKYMTTYFRTTVTIANKALYTSVLLNLVRDDGAVIYINGIQEVLSNMPASFNYLTGASANVSGAAETQVFPYTIPTTNFVNGVNTIAVEVHQDVATSSDLGFNLEVIGNAAATPPVNIIAYGENWKYLDNGTDQGTGWRASGFNDASWKTGPSKFGYGDAAATVVFSGCGTSNYPAAEDPNPACNTKYITTYFRKTFNITGINTYSDFTFNVVRDDGYVIYVNGVEVARDNMPGGAITNTTGAVTAIGGTDETTPVSFSLASCAVPFVEGSNTIAVEIHQTNGTSSDLGFNLELMATPATTGATPALSRGPYLQSASGSAITFRWRTTTACKGRVKVGLSNGVYTTASQEETCPATEHMIRVTGLMPDTKYFYQVENTNGIIFQGAADNFFRTNPLANTTRKITITAFGDCGRNTPAYQDDNLSNYLSFLSANGIDAPDAWILLGDNAYTTGSEAEFTSNFFDIYKSTILKNHKMYPSPGNHDYGNTSANKTLRNLPYHNIFSVPQNGESGGVASNKQNYYSFDVGNIHFLSLDSYGIESDGTSIETSGASAMKTWLDADLAANTKKWVIAYWHHPPYTKSSHNSDTEGDLVNIRQNFITFLENRGVDMIVCGHSHAYERGYLLKNFTGSWTSFNPATHAVSTSSATYTSNTTCPYVYNTSPANHGTVYVVAGSAGASGGTNAGFGANALPFAVNDAGIFYFEVEDNRLDAKMLRRNGTIFDRFTIIKDANKTTNYSIVNGSSQTLTASWPKTGNYTWTNVAATARSVSVTPPDNSTTNYTVTDDFGCVADNFSITTSVTLPVSILSFDVMLQNKKANVFWSTATEINSAYFTVERSANAIDFTPIATVAAAGNSSVTKSYSYTDAYPLPGTSHYRLSQTGIDGHKNYVGIKRINNNSKGSFEVKSLTGSKGKLVLQITASERSRYSINVYDAGGKKMQDRQIDIGPGVTTKEFELSTGVFIWEVKNEKGEAVISKTVVG